MPINFSRLQRIKITNFNIEFADLKYKVTHVWIVRLESMLKNIFTNEETQRNIQRYKEIHNALKIVHFNYESKQTFLLSWKVDNKTEWIIFHYFKSDYNL